MSKTTNDKSTLANDTSAFRRTVAWSIVAAVIHIAIICGVSATQWAFKAGEADKAAAKDANAAANAANAAPANAANTASNASDTTRNTSRNTPSDDWLNPSSPNAAGNRPVGNSAVERRITESDPSKPAMTSEMSLDD